MKRNIITLSFFIIIVACFSFAGFAQKITAANLKKIVAKEDSLKDLSFHLNTDTLTQDRMVADSLFTKTLVRALLIKNSFYYPFDSVQGISQLYAPDSTFRIFTWTLSFNDYYSRQKGAIQMRTTDGSLKLFPLRDISEFTAKPLDSVRTRNNWIGAMYYNMVETKHLNKSFYTLFGFDNNSAMSSMKWIEVLTFDKKNEPVFGGPYFTYENDSIPKPPQYRFNIEFKKGARILVDYIPEMQMILVDHLVSENDDPEHQWTYVPDGDQEGFKWENGKWVHIDKVFTLKLKDGEAPVGEPILDNQNGKDEKNQKGKNE